MGLCWNKEPFRDFYITERLRPVPLNPINYECLGHHCAVVDRQSHDSYQ